MPTLGRSRRAWASPATITAIPRWPARAATGTENIAALLDLPVTYDADGFEFLLRPSGRLGNERGYYSLASNYAHLDSSLQYSTDLSTATLQGEVARDSSLFFGGGLDRGIGVRRDSEATSADWTRSITERSQIALDASWSKVRYDQSANSSGPRRLSLHYGGSDGVLCPHRTGLAASDRRRVDAISRSTESARANPTTSSSDTFAN